jgi:hypothetical protein
VDLTRSILATTWVEKMDHLGLKATRFTLFTHSVKKVKSVRVNPLLLL